MIFKFLLVIFCFFSFCNLYANDRIGITLGVCTPDLKNSKDPSGAEIIEFEWFQSLQGHQKMIVTLKTKDEGGINKELFESKAVDDFSSYNIDVNYKHKKFDLISLPMSKDPKTSTVNKEKGIFKNPLFLVYKLKNKEISKISMTCLTGQ